MVVRVGFTMGSGGGLLKNMCFYSGQRSRRMGLGFQKDEDAFEHDFLILFLFFYSVKINKLIF